MKVLITGGAGYVGSHTVRALLGAGHEVVVLDNLSAGHAPAVCADARLCEGDLADTALLDTLFSREQFEAVVHFAAFIEVGESVLEPLKFYDNNVGNSVRLLTAMKRHGVRKFVFSSTCAVYGIPGRMPLVEDMLRMPESPYARAKLAVEWALADSAVAWDLGFVAPQGLVRESAIGVLYYIALVPVFLFSVLVLVVVMIFIAWLTSQFSPGDGEVAGGMPSNMILDMLSYGEPMMLALFVLLARKTGSISR